MFLATLILLVIVGSDDWPIEAPNLPPPGAPQFKHMLETFRVSGAADGSRALIGKGDVVPAGVYEFRRTANGGIVYKRVGGIPESMKASTIHVEKRYRRRPLTRRFHWRWRTRK